MVGVGRKVYVETSIFSYLAARPSRDLITAANQQITHSWWAEQRQEYEIFISQVVLDEAAAGDPIAAQHRGVYLRDLPILEVSGPVGVLAKALVHQLALPQKASADAVHIAVAAVHGIDFLLTWNCTHLANAHLRGGIERSCRDCGFVAPALCTPTELVKGGVTR